MQIGTARWRHRNRLSEDRRPQGLPRNRCRLDGHAALPGIQVWSCRRRPPESERARDCCARPDCKVGAPPISGMLPPLLRHLQTAGGATPGGSGLRPNWAVASLRFATREWRHRSHPLLPAPGPDTSGPVHYQGQDGQPFSTAWSLRLLISVADALRRGEDAPAEDRAVAARTWPLHLNAIAAPGESRIRRGVRLSRAPNRLHAAVHSWHRPSHREN